MTCTQTTTARSVLGRLPLPALAVCALGALAGTESARADPPPPAKVSADAARPELTAFFKQYCTRCHGAEKQRAKVAVHALGGQPKSEHEVDAWKRIVGQLESGHMPPDDAAQPSRQERLQAIASIHGGLEKAGVRQEGNEVDHEALFSKNATAGAPAATEGRLWRLTQPAYEHFFQERFKGAKAASRVRPPWEMVPDPKSGFSDFSSAHRIGEAELEHHLRNALPVVREVMAGRSAIPEVQALSKVGKAATAQQVDDAVAAVFRKVLRRAPAEPERQRYAGFARKNLEGSAPEAAVEQLVLAVLLHPEVLYRVEGAGKEKGQEVLSPYHLARAIAYTLTDQGPDATLLQAAAEGKLATQAEVRAQVVRILNDPVVSRLRVLRFFQEYLGYTQAPDVFKDAPTLHAAEVVPDAKISRKESEWAEASHTFVRDTDWLILALLEKDRNVLYELLTTRNTFTLTKPGRGPIPLDLNTLLQAKSKYRSNTTTRGFFRGVPLALRVYELDELATRRDAWAPDRHYAMPEGHRLGVLTHPSWLVAHSDNFDNNPIHRGKWIRERLLGQKLPEIPITVDAKLPDEPPNTLRDRMRVTREGYCWKCHQRMDPLGLPFEMYDHFGRYRETELKKPVDATGYLEGTGDPRLDGPVKNAPDLIQRLASSQRVEQVFVRHVFRYFLGRNEVLEDGPALAAAHRAYAEGGGSLKALIASLLTSEAFLHRVVTSVKSNDGTPTRSEP